MGRHAQNSEIIDRAAFGYLAPVRRLLLFLCGFVQLSAALAQVDSTRRPLPWRGHHDEITLHTAYHQGRTGFAELGIGRSFYDFVHLPICASYYGGVECRVDRPELIGLKAGFYTSALVAFGLHYVHYMEGPASMDVLRPELGLGVLKAKLTYAYNIGLSSPRMEGINTHMLSLSYAFRVARLKGDDGHRSHRTR